MRIQRLILRELQFATQCHCRFGGSVVGPLAHPSYWCLSTVSRPPNDAAARLQRVSHGVLTHPEHSEGKVLVTTPMRESPVDVPAVFSLSWCLDGNRTRHLRRTAAGP